MDRGDRRHGEIQYAGVRGAGEGALGEEVGVGEGVAFLEVGAYAEGAGVGGGEDDGSYGSVRGEGGAGGGEGVGHGRRDGVHRLGAVEDEFGDVGVAFYDDVVAVAALLRVFRRVVVHGALPVNVG